MSSSGSLASGDVIEAAAEVLIQARRDFFPSWRRSSLRSLEEEQAAIYSQGIERAKAKVADPALRAKLIESLDQQMTQALSQIASGPISATSSPASAE